MSQGGGRGGKPLHSPQPPVPPRPRQLGSAACSSPGSDRTIQNHTAPPSPARLCAQEADPRAPHQPAPWPAGFVADPAMRGADGRTKGGRRAGTAALPLSLPPRSFTPQSLQACGSSASAQPPFPCPFRAWKDGDSFPPLLVSGCLQPSLVPLTPFIPRQAVPSLKSFPCTFWVNLVSCWNSDSDTKVMHVG